METIAKIEQILGRIRMHPEYSACVGRRTLERLQEEADRHSSALEAETGEITTKEKEIFKSQSYERLVKAREFLAVEGLEPYSLSCLGNILEPEKNPARTFRTRSIQFGEFEGAEPGTILFGIKELTDRLQEVSIHPVKRATDAHISLISIHPYFDGNGRAARLLQDVCLESMAYPSGIIPVTDRGLYIHLMNRTVKDRKNFKSTVYEPSESETLLQEFIGSKVLASAERLESELQKRRFYTVGFSKIDSPNLSIRVKHLLAGSRITPNPLSVHLESEKNRREISFCVSGDIGYKELDERVKEIANKYSLKYKCELHRGCTSKK